MTRENPFVVLNNPGAVVFAELPASTNVLSAAIEMAGGSPRPGPHVNRKTQIRTVSRRGIIWLGQTCNLHCDFCYFIDRVHTKDHPEHAFMPLEKAQSICRTLADYYGNTSVDIEGGEPTIYPKIVELIAYCRAIGLYPTLITNAIVLDDIEKCRRMCDAGIRDFKISIHGLGEVHDRLVGRKNAHARQMRAIANMRTLGIPFRFNTVLTPAAIPQLPDIARLAAETGALCVNWLGYNPHEDQLGKKYRTGLIPNFTEMRGPLTEALDILDAAEIETNVRYMPACMVEERHRRNVYDYQQMFFDHREWDLASWAWTTLPPQRNSAGPISDPVSVSSLALWARFSGPIRQLTSLPLIGEMLSIKRLVNHPKTRALLLSLQRALGNRQKAAAATGRVALYNRVARLHSRFDCRMEPETACHTCAANETCSGVLRDYHETFGFGEARPIEGRPSGDPLRFIQRQHKVVETEDESWALAGAGREG